MRYQLIAHASDGNSHYRIFRKVSRSIAGEGPDGMQYYHLKTIGPYIHRYSGDGVVWKSEVTGDRSGDYFRHYIRRTGAEVLWG